MYSIITRHVNSVLYYLYYYELTWNFRRLCIEKPVPIAYDLSNELLWEILFLGRHSPHRPCKDERSKPRHIIHVNPFDSHRHRRRALLYYLKAHTHICIAYMYNIIISPEGRLRFVTNQSRLYRGASVAHT